MKKLAYKLCRLRQKLIWIGGWEKANCGGWHFDLGPTPITILSCLTIYGWGWQLRLPGTWLVWSKHSGAYLSPTGTPNKATRWFRKLGGHRDH